MKTPEEARFDDGSTDDTLGQLGRERARRHGMLRVLRHERVWLLNEAGRYLLISDKFPAPCIDLTRAQNMGYWHRQNWYLVESRVAAGSSARRPRFTMPTGGKPVNIVTSKMRLLCFGDVSQRHPYLPPTDRQ